MKLKIEITMDNAAFNPEWHTEAQAILDRIASRFYLLNEDDPQPISDTNGNIVGTVAVLTE